VQWRHGQEVGVAFPDRAPAVAAPAGELAERVAQLETEIASLRRALKRLKSEIASGSDDEAA